MPKILSDDYASCNEPTYLLKLISLNAELSHYEFLKFGADRLRPYEAHSFNISHIPTYLSTFFYYY